MANGQQRPWGIASLSPPRLPKGGVVRLGEKVENANGKEHPRELDYFNVEDAPALKEVYGDQPRRIRGMFASNDVHEVIDLGYKKWHQNNTIACQGGNGKAIDIDQGGQVIDCLEEDCETVKAGKCHRQITIAFIPLDAPTIAIHTVTSGGWRTTNNTMAFVDLLLAIKGHLAGIPWVMIREPYKCKRTTGDGKEINQVHHTIRFDLEQSITELIAMQAPAYERPAAFDTCEPGIYPRSVREAPETAALNPAPVEAEVIPAGEPLPADVMPPAEYEHPDVDPNIVSGFDILGLSLEQRAALLKQYQGQDAKLLQYLSAKVDATLDQQPEPTGTNGDGRYTF